MSRKEVYAGLAYNDGTHYGGDSMRKGTAEHKKKQDELIIELQRKAREEKRKRKTATVRRKKHSK